MCVCVYTHTATVQRALIFSNETSYLDVTPVL